jgi:hypothetical protein
MRTTLPIIFALLSAITVQAKLPPPGTNTEPAPAWTIGTKRFLVIRCDFPDKMASTSTSNITPVMDGLRASYQVSSYGKLDFTYVYSAKQYRLPKPATYYANYPSPNGWEARYRVRDDILALASADYDLSQFDRILMKFPNISASGNYIKGNFGTVGNKWVWLNGGWNVPVLRHETGHSMGLIHEGEWKTTNGNPVSATGTEILRGDLCSVMGGNPFDALGAKLRPDYSAWQKYRMGWITDAQVRVVTQRPSSNIYRIYRHDDVSAWASRTLAVKIPTNRTTSKAMVGNTIDYWLSVRRNFYASGVVVNWGFKNNHFTFAGVADSGMGTSGQLIDTNNPNTNPQDAMLQVGQAPLVDSITGITIRVVAEGGTAPYEWSDVKVTLL